MYLQYIWFALLLIAVRSYGQPVENNAEYMAIEPSAIAQSNFNVVVHERLSRSSDCSHFNCGFPAYNRGRPNVGPHGRPHGGPPHGVLSDEPRDGPPGLGGMHRGQGHGPGHGRGREHGPGHGHGREHGPDYGAWPPKPFENSFSSEDREEEQRSGPPHHMERHHKGPGCGRHGNHHNRHQPPNNSDDDDEEDYDDSEPIPTPTQASIQLPSISTSTSTSTSTTTSTVSPTVNTVDSTLMYDIDIRSSF